MAERLRALVRRWRGWSGTVRGRTTLAAVLVVAMVLLVGSISLVASLRGVLTREVQSAAELAAVEAVDRLEAGASLADITEAGGDEAFVQVVDVSGAVIAASAMVAGEPPVAHVEPGEVAETPVRIDDDQFAVAAASAHSAQGRVVVLAARSLDRVGESTAALTGLLAGGLPLVLLVLGSLTWRLVGRALAPVEAVRHEVDAISAAELHRRVPQPAGDDEIARLAATMNRMLDRLHRAQQRQRRFVADASHELRSPIAAIRQHAEVALAHPERVSQPELAATAHAESVRLQRLVDDLLLLAQADERALRLRPQPLDLDDVVFEQARRVRAAADLRVESTAVSAGRVIADPAAARRLVRNIVDNAARHARSAVTLSLSERNGQVVLNVDDDGPGIPPEQRQRVFERFVRLDDARARDTGGAGLGLAIAAELVAAHGGQIGIADSPCGGTRVTLSFPAAEWCGGQP